jgi:hypothetical protein
MTHYTSRARSPRSPAAAQKESRGVMRKSAATAQLEALAEAANGLRFPPALWDEEPPEHRQKDLGAEYRKGELLREGIDYRAAGHCAWAVEGRDDLALVICKSKKGLPHANVIECGYYAEDGVAYPALVIRRYTTTSRALERPAAPEE